MATYLLALIMIKVRSWLDMMYDSEMVVVVEREMGRSKGLVEFMYVQDIYPGHLYETLIIDIACHQNQTYTKKLAYSG